MAETIEGTIERITFQAEDTGYTVARLLAGEELVTVVGVMAGAQVGEGVRLEGEWSSHPQYGRQFKFSQYTPLYPATLEGIRRYLGSGLIKGIGPVTAQRIVEHFGMQTLEVIDRQPERLLEVPGTGPKRVEIIRGGWQAQRQIKDVMVFLQSHGVGTAYAVKIYKTYGDQAIAAVQANPYCLEQDIWGIGFLSADRIARNLGVLPEAPERLKAGLRYVLNQAGDEGHVFLPRMELLEAAQKELEVAPELLAQGLAGLAAEGGAVLDGERVYLPPLHQAEVGIAASLLRLLRAPLRQGRDQVGEAIAVLEEKLGIQYEAQQREGLLRAAQSKVMVLTGGPGTGKTTITRGIIALLEQQGQQVLLCSPTGRAAKKLAEATGKPARTIHRLLGFKPPKGFEHHQDNPLKCQALIADEVSMVDVALMHSLLKALPASARVVLVGDVDQLPSVGPGKVLRELIASGAVPVVRLTHIFRQAQESQIVTNAHLINQGECPAINNREARDFFFIEEEEPEQVATTIQELCAERLPRRYNLDPIEDIQVLAPMYRGETGASNLNQALQQRLNPKEQGWKRGGVEYRVGDKVMQVRNNYEKGVFNGDVGRLRAIDPENQVVRVLFEEEVEYEFSELDELVLAYAVSVHKSQGSEYRAVVLPLTTQHYLMLQRNLLYTAITRARELVVMVGTKKALGIAVRNGRTAERHTALAARLRELSKGS
ncbi:MAG: ATP-dependent RecD-like DNA helicase [Candidatus Handelsmanbacteria bacterium]|nr:ATP-dependent RecD-like DNA helicase [Candidatus Handelsmanbacteria bacterium]